MREFKGTKGIWHIMEGGFGIKKENKASIYATNEDLEIVCNVHMDRILHDKKQDYLANAKLIAAAPIMFNALSEIAEKLDSEEMNVNSQEYKLWKICNDAINKALGDEEV